MVFVFSLATLKILAKFLLFPIIYYFGCFLWFVGTYLSALKKLPSIYRMTQVMKTTDPSRAADLFLTWGKSISTILYPFATFTYYTGLCLLVLYCFGFI